jgi:NADH-quinone oxidoreductase subunit C
VTTSPSDLAARVAGIIGSDRFSADNDTPKVAVGRDGWIDAHRALQGDFPYFSWLSAIDWEREVAVGDPPADESVATRFEVLSCLGNTDGDWVVLSTDIPKDDPALPTLTGVFGGANWHEREATEMFGIDFTGHPNPTHLYLPDGFEGHPLRKTFPLRSREVKPWPGSVDVEGMPGDDTPSTENPEDAG